MTIEIKKLTPELESDFFTFFETDAHADNPNEDRCYCVNWISDNQDKKTDFSTPNKRKELAKMYIKADTLQGYLAYQDNKVIGWCNVNTKSNCIHCNGWQLYMGDIPTNESQDNKIKSIYCFAIVPHMKRKGVASKMLEMICNDAKKDGFDYIEVFPIKNAKDNFMSFMGPVNLYKKHGFMIVGETKRDYIMQKTL